MRLRRKFTPRFDRLGNRDVPSGMLVPIIVPVTIGTSPTISPVTTQLPSALGGSSTQLTPVSTSPVGGQFPTHQYAPTNPPADYTPDQLLNPPGYGGHDMTVPLVPNDTP